MTEGGGIWHTSFRSRSVGDYYLTAAGLRTLIKELRRAQNEEAKCPADRHMLEQRIGVCEALLEEDLQGTRYIPTRSTKVKKLSVIGLGKLGSPMVACLSKTYEVIGVDIDQRK